MRVEDGESIWNQQSADAAVRRADEELDAEESGDERSEPPGPRCEWGGLLFRGQGTSPFSAVRFVARRDAGHAITISEHRLVIAVHPESSAFDTYNRERASENELD